MRSLTISFCILGTGLFFQSSSVRAEIYDGGTFTQAGLHKSNWTASAEVHGTGEAVTSTTINVNGQATSPEKDRAENAPLSKPIYALAKDGECYRGNFTKTKNSVALVIYSKSHVTPDHCVYQSESSIKDPNGFAVVARDGGICVPVRASLFDGKKGHAEWTVNETGGPVSLKNCFDHTVAYGGQSLKAKKGQRRSIASSVESTRLGFVKAVEHTNTDVTGTTEVNLLDEAKTVAINDDGSSNLTPAIRTEVQAGGQSDSHAGGQVNGQPHDSEVAKSPVSDEDSNRVAAETMPAKSAMPIVAPSTVAAAAKNDAEANHEQGEAPPSVVIVASAAPVSDAVASAAVKSTSNNHFTVQLASFLSEDDAKSKISWLKNHELDSFEMTASVNGMTRYRVCVGHYNSRNEARSSMAEILKQSGFTTAVVQKVELADDMGQSHSVEAAVQHGAHLANAARAVNGFDESMKPAPEGKFAIFISSHLKETDAKDKLKLLKKKGVDAYETVEVQGGETRYRVLSGHFASMRDAKKALPKIAKLTGNPDVSIESTKDESKPD